MYATQDELLHVQFNGVMAEILARVNPELYQKDIQIEKGTKVPYIRLTKALYGTVLEGILQDFWNNKGAVRINRTVLLEIRQWKALSVWLPGLWMISKYHTSNWKW